MSEKNADVFGLDGIEQLIELMKKNDVSELDLEQGASRLKLRRGSDGTPVQVVAQPIAPAVPAPVAPVAPAAPQVDESAYIKTINSPMVGTFYAASSPSKPPYVKVGDRVTPDQTVCIIEAMKVYNDIQAELSGKIVEVLVHNSDPVEYGTPMFKVDTRA